MRRKSAVVVAAVLISLITGFLAGAAAAGIGWAASPGAPDERTLSGVIFPGQNVRVGRDDAAVHSPDGWRGHLFGSDDEDVYGRQYLGAPQAAGTDAAGWLAQARDRLTAAGWTYRGPLRGGSQRSFWATRDGYAVEVGTDVTRAGEPFDPAAAVVRTQPWWITVGALAAGAVGMLGGWLLVGWVRRRTGHRPAGVRSTVTVLTSVIVVLMLPHALLGAYLFASDAAVLDLPTGPPWVALFKGIGWAMFVASIALAAAVVAIASWPSADSLASAPETA
jgi:hypothetical protein